jgi:hypothetical protein
MLDPNHPVPAHRGRGLQETADVRLWHCRIVNDLAQPDQILRPARLDKKKVCRGSSVESPARTTFSAGGAIPRSEAMPRSG